MRRSVLAYFDLNLPNPFQVRDASRMRKANRVDEVGIELAIPEAGGVLGSAKGESFNARIWVFLGLVPKPMKGRLGQTSQTTSETCPLRASNRGA